MKIGIVGSGKMGGALGGLWAANGHTVLFSYSRDQHKLDALAAAAGPQARAGTPREAVEFAEVILFAVVWEALDDVLGAIGSVDGKILIDCTNPIGPDRNGLLVGHTSSGAEVIAGRLPGARIVKAFNSVFAESLQPDSELLADTVLYCGDDAGAKATVARLIDELDFASIDAGPLAMARYLEPYAFLRLQLYLRDHTPFGVLVIRPLEERPESQVMDWRLPPDIHSAPKAGNS